jgi:hypothetical protein
VLGHPGVKVKLLADNGQSGRDYAGVAGDCRRYRDRRSISNSTLQAFFTSLLELFTVSGYLIGEVILSDGGLDLT